jgi:hypothetical protein
MSPHVHKLVRTFESLPADFTPDDLESAIVDTLSDVPADLWEQIAEAACDRYEQTTRERVTLFLANFGGTLQ